MQRNECGRPLWRKIYVEWCNLDITNKSLLLIGLVLLIELIASVFLHVVNGDTTTDAFFRMALSSVLGYFLGGINTGSSTTEQSEVPIILSQVVETKKGLELPEQNFQNTTYIRTIFVAFVCLMCIATLAATTFMNVTNYEAGLIQLRNTISTTLGFLISKANRKS